MAILVARVVLPSSKHATHRTLCEQIATNSLSRLLKMDDIEVEQLYVALDWLSEPQEGLEKRLAKRHLNGSTGAL
ncbi:hypothetical protein AWB78_08480 [Caballeronia calidae]|uniref:Uncharacterized protein n=1 Tax=Caballeronia calidae TaxID=1777139 RepID=A0A158EK07_9BURK|nr:hypothetical protein [Caballeronia calidae]SAL07222.1 hypothetical protein AWB78_08480 [Caballeronia calidae]